MIIKDNFIILFLIIIYNYFNIILYFFITGRKMLIEAKQLILKNEKMGIDKKSIPIFLIIIYFILIININPIICIINKLN